MRRKREAPGRVPRAAIREPAGRPHGTARWLVLGVVLCGLGIGGCGDGDLPAQLAPSNGPDQEVRGFTLTESVGSLMRWRLTARSAATYRNRGVIVAQAVSIDFFDASGKPYSHLTRIR